MIAHGLPCAQVLLTRRDVVDREGYLNARNTFSRLLSLTGFLDWQRNVPLVSQSSYPTTTADFGISMKFSLTR